MQHVDKLELFARALRSRICTKCYQRPPLSETMPPSAPRVCEPTCPIFMNLPKLVGLAARPPTQISTELLVRNVVCQTCKAAPSAGDYCADGLARTCPLSRYNQDVIDVLKRTIEA
jgi:hypothetical protein